MKFQYISNFTDVDDKIINGAKAANMTTTDFSERYIAAFYEDTDALNVKRASQNPKATEFIEAMIEFIQELVDKEFAYVSQGDVYFRVSKSKDYAKLANKILQIYLQGLLDVRMKKQNLKNHQPIALWKSAKADEVSWQAPWGAGRPGWHIECSVMSTSLLGENN